MERPKIKSSLLTKITLVTTLLMIGFGLAVIIAVGRLITQTMEDDVRLLVESTLTEQSHETARYFDMAKLSVEAMVNIPEISQYLSSDEPKPQDKKILKLLNDYSQGRQLSSLYLINKAGVALVSTDPSFVGNDFSFRKYVQNALKGQSYSEMAIGVISKQPGLYFSAPVKDGLGEVIGVAVGKLDTQPIYANLEVSKVVDYGNLSLINADGVIVHSTKKDFVYKSLAPLSSIAKEEIIKEKRYGEIEILPLDYKPVLDHVLFGENKFGLYLLYDEKDGEEEVVGVVKVGEFPFYLMSESNKEHIYAEVKKITLNAGSMIFGAVILSALSVFLYLRSILKQLSKLKDYAVKVSGGSLDENVEIRTGDELESLAESVKGMVQNLKKAYSGLEEEVGKKTAMLSSTLAKMEEQNVTLEESKTAILNVMDDLNVEKDKIASEKNRIETILKSIGDGVFVTDVEGRVVMINHAVEEITGFSSEEILNKDYKETFIFVKEDDPTTKYPDFVKDAIKLGKVKSLLPYSMLVAKDKRTIPVLDSAAPLITGEGKVFGCVVVFRDNTKERELEKSKDEFLSVASHQLRTPLGGMRWNLELLIDGDYGKLPKDLVTRLSEIHETTLMMISLVNDLLNVSRIDQGRVMDEPVEVDLGDLLKQKMDELKPLAQQEQVDLKLTVEEGVPKVLIDPKRFGETMTNLISNSIKYHKKDGWVRVGLGLTKQKEIEITIADNGIGIPKGAEHRLFEKFFRADNALKKKTEGSGLGLYIAKKFIDNWGGNIRVESNEGVGTTFIVLLPRIIKQLKLNTKNVNTK